MPPPVVLDSVSVDSQRLKANSEKQLMAQTDDKKASKGDISTLPLPNSNASGSGTDDEAAKRKTDIADAEKRVAAKRKADIAAAERRAEAKRKATRERSEKSSKDASKNSPEVYVTKTEKIMTPEDGKPIESKTYKVRLNLKGKMKKAEILVDGQEVKVLERNIWGTPQYIEFKSSKTTHRITFVKDGVSCTVENIVIDSGDVDINPCSF